MENDSRPFANVRSSALDGRLRNPFLRKDKLRALHKALVANQAKLQEAMRSDTPYALMINTDIRIEFGLTLQCITNLHDSIDTARILETEYNTAHKADSDLHREPVGIVVIEPSTHSFLHSLICALTPAIAAGNCVIVQTKDCFYSAPGLLLGIIARALGNDIFAFTERLATDEAIGHRHVRVLQNGCDQIQPSNYIISSPEAPVFAFVERDASIKATAQALVTARLYGGGRAPYAPDVVLVNEWVKQEFLEAATTAFDAALADHVVPGGTQLRSGSSNDARADSKIHGHDESWTKLQGIRDESHRPSIVARGKVKQPLLLVHTFTSVDDAIDLCREIGHAAASYVFTSNTTAKYFCQFVDAEACFVNTVPFKLLYGPMAPQGHPPLDGSYGLYGTELFSIPRPIHLVGGTFDRDWRDGLSSFSSQEAYRFVAEKSTNISEPKRPKSVTLLGFFEQGILTGMVVALASILVGTGSAVYYYSS